MRTRPATIAAPLALLGVLLGWSPSSPETPLRDRVGEVAVAVADTWLATIPAASMDWDWGEGVAAFGLLELARVTGDERYPAYVLRYLERHRDEVDPPLYYWNDDLTPALSAVLLALREEAPVAPLIDGAVHYIFETGPRTPSGGLRHLGQLPFFVIADLWVDSLFHLIPLLVRLEALQAEAGHLDEAVHQTLLFARVLQDPESGLFTHAWIDDTEVPVPAFEARAFWARGNGWALAALVDLLAALPAEHPARAELLARTRLLADAVGELQHPSGLWHTLLLDETTYLETAGSALLTYALARGVRHELLPRRSRHPARRGMRGLLTRVHEDASGTVVTGTSGGTLPVADLYAAVPVADQLPHGVGAWLLAASEFSGTRSAPACDGPED